ncbi:EutN/CcmL family microcompartment protein [bacterium]|nr:EutN/CcmL family microcompartment protein [bacterium]
MLIGKVIGNIVSNAKVSELKPMKLYILQVYDYSFSPTERYEVVVDGVGAGIGDYVLFCGGSAARLLKLTEAGVPIDMAIIARIDDFNKLKKD